MKKSNLIVLALVIAASAYAANKSLRPQRYNSYYEPLKNQRVVSESNKMVFRTIRQGGSYNRSSSSSSSSSYSGSSSSSSSSSYSSRSYSGGGSSYGK